MGDRTPAKPSNEAAQAMGYYLHEATRVAERVRKEAPQMQVERLDYGFRVIVYPPAANIGEGTKVWTLMQPPREETGAEHIQISDESLAALIDEWNRDYAPTPAQA